MTLSRAIFGLVTLCSLILPARAEVGKKVFCYYSSFAQNRQGVGKFLPEDIDPYLCTHIIFAFVDINREGTDLRAFNRNDIGPSGLYERTIALKEDNPALKVLLAVGGWQIGSKPFMPMISNPHNTRTWVKNVVKYLRKYNFDGFDVDWEFPATRGSPPEDKYRYTKLMKALYEAFEEESQETGREKLLLTMATASGTYFIKTSYESRKIIPYMDYMLLMTYNYHGQWDKKTGHHTGMWKHRNDPPGEQSELNQNWSIDYWLEMGVPKEKLVIGLATYGMSFTLANPNQHGVHSPVTGGGRKGQSTKETGILSYYEICQNINSNRWKTEWIEDQEVPYAYGGDQWVGFDSVDSIRIKAKHIVKRQLAGAFVWSVEMDDFGGVCGGGKYPLLSTVTSVLKPYEGVAKIAPAENRPRGQKRRPANTDDDVDDDVDSSASSDGTSKTKNLKPSKGMHVKQWGKPTWRPWNRKTSRAPWWKPKENSGKTTHNTDPNLENIASDDNSGEENSGENNQRGKSVHSKKNQWDDSLHGNSQWEEAAQGKARKTNQWQRPMFRKNKGGKKPAWKQNSPAGANAGGSVTCQNLGSGLFAHPDSCEKFIMCLPGAWRDYPAHVMACPSGTRFDGQLRVCNFAASVECY